MSDNIELVIKISKDTYKDICESGLEREFIWDEDKEVVIQAVKSSTPLPKGHGELIDRDKIEFSKTLHDAIYGHIYWSEAIKLIKYSAPTIIEADKESEE